jgi:hypothetical protein
MYSPTRSRTLSISNGSGEILNEHITDRSWAVDAPEDPIGQSDGRVEVGTRNRAQGEDQRHQNPCCAERVLEQLQTHVDGHPQQPVASSSSTSVAESILSDEMMPWVQQSSAPAASRIVNAKT